jgi:hypothetical protein
MGHDIFAYDQYFNFIGYIHYNSFKVPAESIYSLLDAEHHNLFISGDDSYAYYYPRDITNALKKCTNKESREYLFLFKCFGVCDICIHYN